MSSNLSISEFKIAVVAMDVRHAKVVEEFNKFYDTQLMPAIKREDAEFILNPSTLATVKV